MGIQQRTWHGYLRRALALAVLRQGNGRVWIIQGLVALLAVAGVLSCGGAKAGSELGALGQVGQALPYDQAPVFLAAVTEGLARPLAVAVSSTGWLYMADGDCRCVQVYDEARKLAYTLGPEVGESQIQYPVALALAQDGSLYVSDLSGGAILRFRGRAYVGRVDWGDIGSIVKSPVGLALEDGYLYVNDVFLHQVLVFQAVDGKLVRRVGNGRGTAPGDLAYPNFSLPLPNGSLLVADSNNDRLQVFDSSGAAESVWDGPVSVPRGMAQSPSGNILVASTMGGRVEVYTPQGHYLGGFEGLPGGPNDFGFPTGIAVRDNKLYVADRFNGQVQVGVWPTERKNP